MTPHGRRVSPVRAGGAVAWFLREWKGMERLNGVRRASSIARRALCTVLLAMMLTACGGHKSINEPGGSGGAAATGGASSGGKSGATGGIPGSGGGSAEGTGGKPGSGGEMGTGGHATGGGNPGTGGSGPETGGRGGAGGGSGGAPSVDAGTTSDGATPADAGCPNPGSAPSYMTAGCGASAPAPLCLIQYLCISYACSCSGKIISGCQSFPQPFAYSYQTSPPDGGACDPNTPPPR